MVSRALPYWRLSGFYFFYFAALGALVPYWNPYLATLGYGEAQIGILMAIVMATKIVAPYVWGWIADHTGHRMRIVRLASLLATLCYAGVLLDNGFWWLVLVMATFSFFWNAALPQFEATTMNYLGDSPMRYNGIRLWGSVGFIVAVAVLGVVFDHYDIGLLPWILVFLFAGIWGASLIVPEQAVTQQPPEHESLRSIIRRPEVVSLLLVVFLAQASHGSYYVFYTRYLETAGYRHQMIGLLWALGVVAEILLFMFMARLFPRFGARRLLLAALALTTLRWLLIGTFVQSAVVLVFSQLLHAASFGVLHAVSIHLIHRTFTGRHQGRGQALYSSISFGAGGAFGSLASGYLWEYAGAQTIWFVAAGMGLTAWVITWRGILHHQGVMHR